MACFCGDRREIKLFQDDIRERKEEEGKDIGDLHRCPIYNFFAAVCSSSSSSVKCAICRTRFPGLFWNDGLLLIMESSSLWKQATTNEIQDD